MEAELGEDRLENEERSTSDKVDEPTALPTSVYPSGGMTVEKLFTNYHNILLNYLRRNVGSYAEAEDIAQEVYYRLARKIDFEQVAYPKAFLMQTAKNCLIDIGRSAGRLDVQSDNEALELELDCGSKTPERQVFSADILKTMEGALEQLSPKCQAVFVMNRMDGISYRQIAVQLGLSRSMVEKYMSKALKHLKEVMRDHYEKG